LIQKLPIVRLFVYTFGLVVLVSALGFVVCLKTGNFRAMAAVMGLSTVIGMVPLQRWWLKVNRAMGVPQTKFTRERALIAIVVLASIIAAVVVDHLVYAVTQSRLAEAATAICTAVPLGFFVIPESFRRMRAVTANDLQITRLSYYLQIGLAVMFGANLCLWLTNRHVAGSLSWLHEWNIAGYFMIVALSPFTITLLRRRYFEAKALSDASQPVTMASI
jgi:hypothetical protein